MFLDPDDGLREVQLASFKYRRIIAAVGVAAPQVEAPPRQQGPGQVPEPGMQEFFKVGLGQKVVDQRAVLGTQLFVGGRLSARRDG